MAAALAVLCQPVFITPALAHPGRTAADGCHNDRKNGGRHCHGGTSTGNPPARKPDGANRSSADDSAEGRKSGPSISCTVASISDGDTFRCAESGTDGKQIRVRLSGVAARERDGSCSDGHPCPTASAEAATTELTRLALGELLICQKVGDTYGRVAAFCQRQDGIDLSCAMIESGTAVKWSRYWGSHRCP